MNAPARDLALPEPWMESLERSLTRRAAAAHNSPLCVGRRQASLAALFAVTAPTVTGFVAIESAAPAEASTQGHHPELREGSRGDAVARLQRELGIAADGVFGPATLARVKSFQRGHGLMSDGIVGPATWAALGMGGRANASAGAGAGAHLPAGRVQELQRLLGIGVDGIWGPQTLHAVRSFQARHGLAVDGVAGPLTFAALERGSSAGHRAPVRFSPSSGSVRDLQRRLGLSADGVFGPQTRGAVLSFQRRHGLTPDGVVGPVTWRALGVGSSRVLKMRGAAHGGGGGTNVIGRVIAAGNRIARTPYVYGGGHASFQAAGYDCSGSVSFALHGGGLLRRPMDSSALASYGSPGRGRSITVFANSGHAFMVVDGRRFDTSARSETGSRWTSTMRSTSGYVARHPAGY
jgi:peptidoglycan hydrolase-like protein with peptidoglycan-binding domain